MNTSHVRGIFLAGLLLSSSIASQSTLAQGLFGRGGEEPPVPHITLARAEIALEIPTPLQGNDFDALLAQATAGSGASAAKEAATRRHTDHLRQTLETQLRAFFADEEVPLIADNTALTLHNFIDVVVVKQLSGLKSTSEYELERGNLSINGEFRFRVHAPSGQVLHEKRLDLADLYLKEKYEIKSPADGSSSEDNTDEKLDKLLAQLVDRLLAKIDNDLEADSLRELNSSDN
ncbi:hypothetical protein [Microbulbifer aggregans]|uniref:hypothetical protein n=1 Tax=Microbulbifer aggregans TaxID=1769779 RepID=UPI001CFEA163|nr:hypothetical protein [Microbulbifer aggregans]